MKRTLIPMMLFSLLVILSLACSSSAPAAAPTFTPDAQATINAAIAATAGAQAYTQATIDAAIASTAVAMPPTATPGPEVEYVTMTEEELAALIDQAVNAAVAATTTASTATTQTTSDNAVTYDEVQSVEVYVQGAEQAIAYAEELIETYYSLYGDLATETISLLTEIEQDLDAMASSTAALAASLVEIENTLSQGLALAEETINQLENAAQAAAASLAQVQEHARNWVGKTQVDRENRANQALNVKPDRVPTDLQSTLQEAFNFVDLVRGSLGDNKISRDEMNKIAQLGANVSAGFSAHGGPKMRDFSGRLNEITGQLARGQNRQARDNVGNFERSLGERPSGPGVKPGGGGGGGGGLLPGRP